MEHEPAHTPNPDSPPAPERDTGIHAPDTLADLKRLAALDEFAAGLASVIAEKNFKLGQIKDEAREIEARILETAAAQGEGIEYTAPNGSRIRARYTPGRASVTWNANRLHEMLSPELRAACLTYTPQPSKHTLAALERDGALAAEIIDAAKVVTPARPRYVLERVTPQ